ncbi:hypothetical protein BGZ49_002930 [Haplosporangium sp. Z 27]|nr:hypothetical protein BGZ49_002930 [Haplosporangium sp. Z 27]
MSGPLSVEFTSDYKIIKFNFTVSDLTELIPRPKGDTLSSPKLDIKPDLKKKPNAKRSNSTGKSSAEVNEIKINEFGITNESMQQFEMFTDMRRRVQDTKPDFIQAHLHLTLDGQATVKSETNVSTQQHSQISAAMPPPSQPPNPSTYGSTTFNDLPQFSSGLMTPTGGVKRRFSAITLAGGAGAIAPSSIQLIQPDNLYNTSSASANSLTYSSGGGLNSFSSLNQLTGNYTASGIVGSPAPMASPLIASAVTISATADSPTPAPATPMKGSKKARNSSVTSTTGNSTKGLAAGSTSTINQGRSRKATGKKEGSAKRKGSVAEEAESVISTTSIVPATPRSAVNADIPSTVGSTAITKARAALTISSPVSIPSPAATPLISTAIRANQDQGEIEAMDFVNIPSDFDPISESNNLTLSDASWSIDAVTQLSSNSFSQMDNAVDDNDHWKYIDEQLLDYDDQEGNSLSIPSLDGMAIPSNSSIISTMSINSATG